MDLAYVSRSRQGKNVAIGLVPPSTDRYRLFRWDRATECQTAGSIEADGGRSLSCSDSSMPCRLRAAQMPVLMFAWDHLFGLSSAIESAGRTSVAARTVLGKNCFSR